MGNKKLGTKEKTSNVHYKPLKEEENENEELSTNWDYLEIGIIALKVLLWCLMMILFVYLEFGAVFFVVSVFYVMFTNFRKTKRSPNEPSAYSVFNPNCEAIKGTLTAQQFENEIKFGIGGLS